MSTWILSYVALSALLTIEWMALRTLVLETLAVKRLLQRGDQVSNSAETLVGTFTPPFRARLLHSNRMLTDRDFVGQTTTILFVDPETMSTHAQAYFPVLLHNLWSKSEAVLFLICTGPPSACHHFLDIHRIEQVYSGRIGIVVDDDRSLWTSFSVSSNPSGFVIDATGRISRSGTVIAEKSTTFLGPAGATT